MNKEELKNNIETCMSLIIDNLACFNLLIGFDLKEKKLIIADKDTKQFSRIDLEEINKSVVNVINKIDRKWLKYDLWFRKGL